VSDWRSRLKADEAADLAIYEEAIERARWLIAQNAPKRRALYIRAKKREARAQIVVDTIAEAH